MKNKSVKTAFTAIVIIVLAIGAFIFADYRKKELALSMGEVIKDDAQLSDRPINANNNKGELGSIIDNILSDNKNEITNTEDNNKIENNKSDNKDTNTNLNTSSKPPVINIPNKGGADTSSGNNIVQRPGDQSVWKALDEISRAGSRYYTDYFFKTSLITKNGIFYNKSSESIITPSVLVERANLDAKYRYYDGSILLLDMSDIKEYSELSISSKDDGLTVFVSTKYDGKYYLTSASGSGGILSEARYHSLIARYSQVHGSIKTPYPYSQPYDRIINFIRIYEGKYNEYYVRELIMDNKYAMVVLSSTSNTSNIRQYILKNENDNWEVVMEGLENEPRVVVAVNKKIPDFNVSMIPKYTINDYKKSLGTNYEAIHNTLINVNAIANPTDILYESSVDKYCYVVTKKGFKYLVYKDGEYWTTKEVFNYGEAVEFMKQRSSTAPTFIVWDK